MKKSNGSHEIKLAILHRLLPLLVMILVWSAAILARLIHLQCFKSEEFSLQVESQQWGHLDLNPKRGDILDRNLEELAISVQSDTIYAHPEQIVDPLAAAKSLAPILEVNVEKLYQKLTSGDPFVYLKRKISPRQSGQVRRLKIAGVDVAKETKRYYPNRELACHVLGFTGMDNKGLGGLEYYFNKDLSGKKGRIDLRFDARRNSFHRKAAREKTDGNLLVLSLDLTIQHIAEQVLWEAVEAKSAKSGTAIVMDPNTGEILAMASYPYFNPNEYGQYSESVRRNRAILDLYEPGSTFKVVTLASVLNENLSSPGEVIDCRAGTARLAGKVYREAKRSFEDLSLTQVLAKSSNVGTVKLGIRLGNERLHDYVRRFGFGVRTGIKLPGEEGGLFRPVDQWSKISIGAISIGQEIAVTPLQMIQAAAAIANQGYLVRPRIVHQVLTPDGDVVYKPEVERQRILRPQTAIAMKRIMATVISEGTGRTASLNGYSAAGKTGTAQKIVDGVYSKSKYVASFIGFAPIDQPALIGLIVIDEPRGIPYGGHVAGPAFKQLMERSLIHLRIPKDVTEQLPDRHMALTNPRRKAKGPAPFSDTPTAPEDFFETGISESVLSILEGGSDLGERHPSFTVELGHEILPDLTGKNLREVADECARLGIQLKIAGSGLAVGQRPAPGKRISRAMVCEVFFAAEGKAPNDSRELALRGTAESAERSFVVE
jgi:cell division protein FtsI/penicillin-binding protein 2